MPCGILEVRIEDLMLMHRKVRKKKVRKYMLAYKQGMAIEPVTVTYCVCTGKYELDDGHHRVVAAHLVGRSSIRAKIEPCYLFNCEGMDSCYEPFSNSPDRCELYWHIRHIILE